MFSRCAESSRQLSRLSGSTGGTIRVDVRVTAGRGAEGTTDAGVTLSKRQASAGEVTKRNEPRKIVEKLLRCQHVRNGHSRLLLTIISVDIFLASHFNKLHLRRTEDQIVTGIFISRREISIERISCHFDFQRRSDCDRYICTCISAQKCSGHNNWQQNRKI